MTAIHEAALQLLGIDYNVLPYGIDLVLTEPDFTTLAHGTASLMVEGEVCGTKTRCWKASPDLSDAVRTARPLVSYPINVPDPETLLRLLPLSPDFRFLQEEYAALAETLYFDRMDDRELGEFHKYVRM